MYSWLIIYFLDVIKRDLVILEFLWIALNSLNNDSGLEKLSY